MKCAVAAVKSRSRSPPPPPPCSPAPGILFSQTREKLQSIERGRTAPGQRPNTALKAGKIIKKISFSSPGRGGGHGASQRRVGCGGIIAAPATGVDVTVNYSIPRPSPPPKLYLREGKNNSRRGRSWNEPKDSSSISKTRTNQGGTRNTLCALSPIRGVRTRSPCRRCHRAGAVPGHLQPGSGVAAGTGGGNRSRAGKRPRRSPRAV